MKKNYLILLLASLLPACAAQIKVKTSSVQMISPEALGGFGKLELGMGSMGTSAIELTNNGAVRAPDVSTPRVISDTRIHAMGGLGLLSRVDLHFDPGAWSTLKLQILGKPYMQAKRGNFSFALLGGYAWKDEDGRGSDLDFSKDKLISVAPNIRYTLKASQWKAGALFGYRLADSVLFYFGANRYEHRYSGGFDNVSGRDGRFAGFSETQSANAGLEFSFKKAFVIRIENAYTESKIPSVAAKSTRSFYGLYLAGTFPTDK
jgi:hypothetical protein